MSANSENSEQEIKNHNICPVNRLTRKWFENLVMIPSSQFYDDLSYQNIF